MPAKNPKIRVIEVNGIPPRRDDPRGRLDTLLLRCGELVTKRLERALAGAGIPVGGLWDGDEGVKQVITRFCDEQGITGKNVLSPVSVAQRAGLLKRQRQQRRRRVAG